MINDLVNKQESWIANYLLVLLFPCVYLSRLQLFQGVHIIYLQTLLSLFALYYSYRCINQMSVYNSFLKWMVCILIAMIINMLFVGNSGVKEMLNSIIIMPSLAVLLFFFEVKRLTSFFIFYGFFLLTSYLLFTGMYSVDTLLVNSRNYISYFFILYMLPYYVYCVDAGKTPSLIPSFFSLLFSILAVGRSGIIVSSLLLFGIILLKFNKIQGFWGVIYKLTFFLFAFYILFYFDFSEFSVIYLSRFAEEGFETAGRSHAWMEYLSSLISLPNLFLGTNVYELPYLSNYLDGSLHNSYLTLHARYGFISFLIIWGIFKGYYYLLKNRIYPLMLIFASLLIKGFTDADTGGNFTGGDIYVYFLFLVYLRGRNVSLLSKA